MIIKQGLYNNCDFFYKVGYTIGDQQNRICLHEEQFMGNDLQVLRKEVFDYYNSRCEWVLEQQAFFNRKQIIHYLKGFKNVDHIVFEAYIFFTYKTEGEDYDYLILDGNIMNINEEVLMSREFENDIYYDELKLDVPWPELPGYN